MVWSGMNLMAHARGNPSSDEVQVLANQWSWLLAQPTVTAVVVGPRRPEHLESAVRAAESPLSQAEAGELADLFA